MPYDDLIPSGQDVLVVNADMTRDLHRTVTETIESNKTHDACTFFLTTLGGDPDGAFRVARCLRHHYKQHIRIVVPSYCKSAGTLLVIVADELVIGDLGELGPLDVQVSKPTELGEQSSCLDIQEALTKLIDMAGWMFSKHLRSMKHGGRLSTRLAGDLAGKFTADLFSPLLSQIDPQRIGEMFRAQEIAFQYGLRLNEYSQNLKNDAALMELIIGYPCHSFVIDRKEANRLFEKVFPPEEWEKQFIKKFAHILNGVDRNVVEYFCASIDKESQNEDTESQTGSNGCTDQGASLAPGVS